MSDVWDQITTAERVATASAGAANAAYFARRAWRATGPTRTAAALLATVFIASVAATLTAEGASPADAALHAPALLANVAVALVLWLGASR